MAQDITKVIDSLRDAAVVRCRERIEHAAMRAKGLLGNGHPPEKSEIPPPQTSQYGVTSLLKRKHGL
jgi:hypothetical protein